MDELIDILNNKGEFTGITALKSEAHKNGWYHATVHVWFYTDKKQILLQQRASTKKVFPSLWDVSVAGHIGVGESIIDSAIRESKEEIGIEISKKQLIKVGERMDKIVHPNGILDNEFKHIFICKLLKQIDELTFQKEEVDDIRLFSFDEIQQSIDNFENSNFRIVPVDFEYYKFIMRTVEKRIKKNPQNNF